MIVIEPVSELWGRAHADELVALQRRSYRIEADLIGDWTDGPWLSSYER